MIIKKWPDNFRPGFYLRQSNPEINFKKNLISCVPDGVWVITGNDKLSEKVHFLYCVVSAREEPGTFIGSFGFNVKDDTTWCSLNTINNMHLKRPNGAEWEHFKASECTRCKEYEV